MAEVEVAVTMEEEEELLKVVEEEVDLATSEVALATSPAMCKASGRAKA